MRRAAGRVLAAIACLCLAVGLWLGALYWRSPVGALDAVDRWWPAGGRGRLVAGGVPFGAVGNMLDIWAPAQARRGPERPVLVFFYGGSWVSGDRREYGFVGRAFAERGFIVVIPDYRKVPGVRFPAFLNDGAAAIRWTHDNIARFGGDPRRIVIAGHSAGAYIAMMLALDGRYLAQAGLDSRIIRAAAGLAGPYDFYPFRWAPAQAAMGNARDPASTQPVTFARADAPPLLLATGTADATIMPRNTIALHDRQRLAGNCRTTVRFYEGLGHSGIVMGLSRPFHGIAPTRDDMTGFFESTMRGADEPCTRRANDPAARLIR